MFWSLWMVCHDESRIWVEASSGKLLVSLIRQQCSARPAHVQNIQNECIACDECDMAKELLGPWTEGATATDMTWL